MKLYSIDENFNELVNIFKSSGEIVDNVYLYTAMAIVNRIGLSKMLEGSGSNSTDIHKTIYKVNDSIVIDIDKMYTIAIKYFNIRMAFISGHKVLNTMQDNNMFGSMMMSNNHDEINSPSSARLYILCSEFVNELVK